MESANTSVKETVNFPEAMFSSKESYAFICRMASYYGVPELLTVPKVAEAIHSNPKYVRDLIYSGQLKAMKLGELKVTTFALNRFLIETEGIDLSDPYNPKPLICSGPSLS